MPETLTQPAPATPIVISLSDTEKLIQREVGMTLESMPDSFTSQSGNDNPIVDPKPHPFPLPKGKIDLRPVTICDVNGPKYTSDGQIIPGTAIFSYAWLSDEDKAKPEFQGYHFVRDDNEGSRGPGGEKILDHYFKDHVIRRGSTHFCFSKAKYAAGHKDEYRKKARLMADSLGSTGSAQAVDFQGNKVAGIMLGAPEDNTRKRK